MDQQSVLPEAATPEFLFAERLPEKPEVWEDILGPLNEEKKSDEFVCKVLIAARGLRTEWDEDRRGWNEAVGMFLRRKRGPEVFREWLAIPSVKKHVTGNTGIIFSHPEIVTFGFYRGPFAHSLVHYNLAEILRVLLQTFPDCKNQKVSGLVKLLC